MPSVFVVGSVNVDLVVRTERLPRPGETVTGGAFSRFGGGKGANQAVAGARSGADVRFFGAVGDDDLGAEAVALLADEGVDVSAVQRIPNASTGVALIVIDARGENQIAVAPGANSLLGASHVSQAWADGAEPGVLLANFEIADDAILAAATAAHRAGRPVVLNPAPARELHPSLAALGPILVPNAGEAMALTGASDPSVAAERIAETTSAPVIVTLGRNGVLVREGSAMEHRPSHDVDVIDTTGAGDAFCGVLAAGIAQGMALDAAVDRAQVAAALSVGAAGARTSPRGAEIDAFMSGARRSGR